MRILQLCPKVPWPPEDGGRIAMRGLALSLLEAGARVRTLALNPRKQAVDPASLPAEARPLRLEAVEIDTSVTVGGALRSLLAGTSYNMERYRSEAFEERLAAIVDEENPDVVLLESLYMVPFLPALRRATGASVALRLLNVEHEIWEGLARNAQNPARRLYLGYLARQLRTYEVGVMSSVDALLPVTGEDAATCRRLGATPPLHVVPVGLEPETWPDLSGRGAPGTLVFLGSLDWRPNVEGVRWFVEEVWPLVRQRIPRARFVVGGSNAGRGVAALGRRDGVEFVGRVPDARTFIASGTASVVPLLSGGGTRVKILEALALGVPCVATSLGATGFDAQDGGGLLLADDPDAFADACVSLLRDGARASREGREGRRRVLERHAGPRIGRDLLEFLHGLLEARPPAPPLPRP